MENYSFQFEYVPGEWFTIGNGTLFPVTNVEGLGGTSPLRIQDDNRGYIDGSYSGRDFYDMRIVYIDVTVLGDGTSTAQENYKNLQNAFAPQPIAYYRDPTGNTPVQNEVKAFKYRLNGNTGDKIMYGRSRGVVTPITPNFTYGYIQCRIMMAFPDPRYYDVTPVVTTENFMEVVNDGWAISCPLIEVPSPSASGTIGDGEIEMIFTNVPTGVPLIIDTLTRIVYSDGYPVRTILSASSNGWLYLPPNSTNYWFSTIGEMTVTSQNAYV